MKRGPQKVLKQREPKRAKIVGEIPSNPLMLPDLIANTLQFVPGFQLFGQNKLGAVCKQWDRTLKAKDFYFSMKFEKLLDECRRSPDGALEILADETLHPYIDLKKAIRLSGCHVDFAKALIEQEEFSVWLSSSASLLGQNNLDIAKFLLDQGYSRNTIRLSKKLPEIALHVLNDANNVRGFDDECFMLMGKHHHEVALHILKTEEFHTALTARGTYYLAKMVQNFPDIAMDVLENNQLKLSGASLAIIGQKHEVAAMYIINSEELLSKLKGEDLANLGTYLPTIAKYIMSTPELCKKLDGKALAQLGRNNLEIAKSILENKELCDKLNGMDLGKLGSVNSKIAMFILNDDALREKLSGYDLGSLAHSSAKVAMYILSSEMLVKQAGEYVCNVAFGHSKVMTHVLNTPSLSNLMSERELDCFRANQDKFDEETAMSQIIFDKAKSYVQEKRNQTKYQRNAEKLSAKVRRK